MKLEQPFTVGKYTLYERPGYFGRQRDKKIAKYNADYGEGNWTLVWLAEGASVAYEYKDACKYFYEESYYWHFKAHPELLDEVCSYNECYDNAITNINSGTDYTIQEAYSTHIQDIAVRNILKRFGRRFAEMGEEEHLLQIRGHDSNGYKFAPGNIKYFDSKGLTKPSLCPEWANPGSVEDFWQSNKYFAVFNETLPV